MTDNTEQQTAEQTEQTYENLNAFAGEAEYIPHSGPEQTERAGPTLGGEELAFVFEMGFGVVATRRGEHWKLSGEEAEQLGVATDRVLAKYLPDMQTGPEVALVLTAGMVFLPRMMLDKQLAETEEAASNGD